MLAFQGVYLLVVAATITGDIDAVGLRKMVDMTQCQTIRSSSFYKDPKYQRVECVEGAAILSESLIHGQVDRLSGTLNDLRRNFQN